MRKKFSADNIDLIDKNYRELISSCKPFLSKEYLQKIENAFHFTLKETENLFYKDKIPLIVKPLQIAHIVANEIGLSSTSLICSLLSEIPAKKDDFESYKNDIFNPEVIEILEGLNRISGLYTNNLSLQTENFIKLLLSLSDDIRIILIKLAERLFTLRNLSFLTEDEQISIVNEIVLLYAPIAHRLGLYKIKTEMEELSMKRHENEIYKSIARKLQETKAEREEFINKFISPLNDELKNLGFKVEIKGRPKSIHSIWNKMKKQGVEFEEVYDLFAIRIILTTELEYEKADCWRVYSIVTNHYTPNPRRLRDWISTPKISGYESLHTTVVGPAGKWVEVQIRTHRMDEIAEKGHASHWKYKETGKSSPTDKWLIKIRTVLERPVIHEKDIADETKISLYSSDIFIFTPNGDIKKLRKDSTVLDFAFSVHSTIGSTCTGAKVNGKIVQFKHTLKNGDKVEILTSKTQTPKQDWLNIVTSTRAKSKIKRALKQREFLKAEEGRELLQRKFNQSKISFNDEIINYLISQFKLKSAIELYQLIGEGKIEFTEIKNVIARLDTKNIEKEKSVDTDYTHYINIPKVSQKGDYLLIDENLYNIDYKFAKCCNPIYGDSIFGFITITKGTKIHRKDCPNAKELWNKYPYRFVRTRWGEFDKNASFSASLFISGIDRAGIVNNISKVITTDLDIEMHSINIDTSGGIFEGKIEVFIKNKTELEILIKNLKKIKGILKVRKL